MIDAYGLNHHSRMGINRDLDDFLDGADNCPAHVNNDQTDTDGDGSEILVIRRRCPSRLWWQVSS